VVEEAGSDEWQEGQMGRRPVREEAEARVEKTLRVQQIRSERDERRKHRKRDEFLERRDSGDP